MDKEEEGEREGGEREGRREQKRGRDTEVVSTRQSHDPSLLVHSVVLTDQ